MLRARPRGPVFLMSWRDLTSYTVADRGMGVAAVRTIPIGAGVAHAVRKDGDHYTAVCGRFVRLWSPRRWLSGFAEELCPDCERLTAAAAATYAEQRRAG